MEDLRHLFNESDREQAQIDIMELRQYIVPILLKRQNNLCAIYGQRADNWDIDHLVYNPRVTINELRLLCVPCHAEDTNFTPFRYRQ